MSEQAEAAVPSPGEPGPRDLRRELSRAMRRCTPKQRQYLRKLVEHNFQPWGRACSDLGLSKGTVWKWRRNERVKAVLELLDEIGVDELDLTARRILTEYSHIAFMRERYAYDESGRPLSPHDMPEQAAAAIVERSYDANGNPKLKFHDKKAALEFLAGFKKLAGAKRIEVTGRDGQPLPGVTPVIHFVERSDDDPD